MADQDERKGEEQVTRNTGNPNPGAEGHGPLTTGRSGLGMGVSTGDYTDLPPPAPETSAGPSTTVTVGADTGQRRDLPDQHALPPTPHDDKGKRPRRHEEDDKPK